MSNNPTAPHAIILIVKAQVHQLLETGELSGNVAHRHKNGEHEVFRLDAQDRDTAIRTLNEFITELRSRGFKKNG